VSAAEITEICSTVVTVATLITGFLLQLRQGKATHTAVNSNLTFQQTRNEQLTAALTKAAIPVPPPPEEKKS
jgi:hypothetical protein